MVTKNTTSQNTNDKNQTTKKKFEIDIDYKKGLEIIKKSKYITTYELSKQTNVKLSIANSFLQKMLNEGHIKKFGGYSSHYIFKPVLD